MPTDLPDLGHEWSHSESLDGIRGTCTHCGESYYYDTREEYDRAELPGSVCRVVAWKALAAAREQERAAVVAHMLRVGLLGAAGDIENGAHLEDPDHG